MDFDTALETFVAGAQKIVNDYFAANFQRSQPPVLSAERGKRYVRIVSTDARNSEARSVHCFVDATNGDVLKAAGWKAPARGARGNIFDERNGLGRMTQWGPEYNR